METLLWAVFAWLVIGLMWSVCVIHPWAKYNSMPIKGVFAWALLIGGVWLLVLWEIWRDQCRQP
jgi:hypothetical protein